MNIKLKFIARLIIITASASSNAESMQLSAPTYLPIANYQKTLSDIALGYMSMLYNNTAQPTITAPAELVAATMIMQEIPKIDRDEALEKMKTISTKIFDVNDTDM